MDRVNDQYLSPVEFATRTEGICIHQLQPIKVSF